MSFDSSIHKERDQQDRNHIERESILGTVCELLYIYVPSEFEMTRPAAMNAVADYGAKVILKTCLQVIEYNRHAPDARISLGRPLTLLSMIYRAPSLHKRFYEHSLHTIVVCLYWDHLKRDSNWEPGHGNARSLLEHIYRYCF